MFCDWKLFLLERALVKSLLAHICSSKWESIWYLIIMDIGTSLEFSDYPRPSGGNPHEDPELILWAEDVGSRRHKKWKIPKIKKIILFKLFSFYSLQHGMNLFFNIKHLSRIEKGTTRWFTQPNNFAKKLWWIDVFCFNHHHQRSE